jgi:hypothetical protein
LEHDLKFYCIISILTVLSISCIFTLNIVLIITSLVTTILLITLYKLHYVFDAIIFKRSNLIQVIEGCELGGERTTAIRRLSGSFCATAAAFIDNTKSNERIEREKIENMISNSQCQFRFVVQVEKVDIAKLLDKLHTKRSMKEIELSRLSNAGQKNNFLRINALKREIEHIENEMARISTGGAPLKVSQYIMTSAISKNRFIAQERAKSQIRELASEFGALLGSKSEILSGNELLDILKFDSGAYNGI